MKEVWKKKFYLQLLIFLVLFSLLYCDKTQAEPTWEKVTSLNSIYIKVLEPTPKGILAGEHNPGYTSGTTPVNGVFFSKDFGKTWQSLGLNNRGVLDLKYFDGKIYATTCYTIDHTNGLFLTDNMGETWQNIGPPASPTKVDRDSQTIYLGSLHYGLYTSFDEGSTWNKLFEGGSTDLRVYEVQSSEDVTLFSDLRKVYRTTDHGVTWEEVEALSNKGIASFLIQGNTVFAGSFGNHGLYLSKDLGQTWERVTSFGAYSVDKIIHHENNYYTGRYDPNIQKYSVYISFDGGLTWNNTGLNIAPTYKVIGMNVLFSDPSFLFVSILNRGVYKYKIPKTEPSKSPFLNIPWEYENKNELIDTITSFFDHSYPLLGYSYFSEPEEEKDTTLNFLGVSGAQPDIYYSSHSGFDFGLDLGTPILAPAPGRASYYYCKDCGNSIKIDHQNGYQTTYMHLQEDGLLTKKDSVQVNGGDVIGKVGLTGRTTGPHLHFEVTKDREMDGSFLNDFPFGRTDPFGWQTNKYKDPWEIFSWEDSLGKHTGSGSTYLWKLETPKNSGVISAGTETEDTNTIILENKSAEFENSLDIFTTNIISYIKPASSLLNSAQKYIKDTSFILNAFNQLGNEVEYFDFPINISILINPKDLIGIDLESLSLHFWNETSKAWKKIPSIFDEQSNKLTATVNHLSWFAVLGDKSDSVPPQTQIAVSGSQTGVWFVEPPLIEFYFEGDGQDILHTFYSKNDGETWEKYTEPFYFDQDGITNLIYKSQDENGNMENVKDYSFHLNLYGKTTEKIKVSGSTFEISN